MIQLLIAFLSIIILYLYWKFYLSIKNTNTKGPSPWFVINGTIEQFYDFTKQNTPRGFGHLWMGPKLCFYSVDGPASEFLLKNTRSELGISKTVPPFPPSTLDLTERAIVWLNGDAYKQHKVLVSGAFNDAAHRSYFPKSQSLVNKAISKILEVPMIPDKGYHKEVAHFWSSITLDVLTASIFGQEFGMIEGKIDNLYTSYKTIMNRSVSQALIDFLHLPIKNPIRESVHCLTTFFNQLLLSKKDSTSHNDMMANLAKSSMEDKDILSDAFTFFLAGHETTAYSLSWAFVELARNPEIQERLYKEISTHFKPGEDVPYDSLSSLPLLEAFIKENLRLHTSLGLFPSRIADKDLHYEGQTIPKGSLLAIFYYAVHRNELHYDEPEKFKLERFLEENKINHRYAYIPFSKGLRECIGNTFSLNQQRLILIKFLLQFKIQPGNPIEKGSNDFFKINCGQLFVENFVKQNLFFQARF